MTITCPRCCQGIVVTVYPHTYEVRTTCPRCGCPIVIEVGVPAGAMTGSGVGPTERKRKDRFDAEPW